MGSDKLLALADRLHIEDGPACVWLRRHGRSESFLFTYKIIFGRRFLVIKDHHGLPVAVIRADKASAPVSLQRMPKDGYADCSRLIPANACGRIYPLSIARGFQSGDIFAYGDDLLFWHKCGFAFAFGGYSEPFLEEIYSRFLSPESLTERRFVLFCEDERTRAFFKTKPNIKIGLRYFFTFPDEYPPALGSLPDGFTLRSISPDNIGSLNGRIVPSFSWDSREEFCLKGRGFAVMDGDTPAAWAFSAAVSREETDIGVETDERYRKRGLATIAARMMIIHIMSEQKRPVWACSSENEGSRRLAERLGFVKCGECFTISKTY